MVLMMAMFMMMTMTMISHRTGPVKTRDTNCCHKMQEHLISIKIIIILFSNKIFSTTIIIAIILITTPSAERTVQGTLQQGRVHT